MLLGAWVLVLGWQVAEHFRVQTAARAELINRAKDISTTVGIVLRSQRRFGVISKERLESALTELVRPAELSAVALLNATGEVVASAGAPVDLHARGAIRPAEVWENDTVTLMNLVDLGTSIAREPERTNPPIVLSMESFTNRPPPGPPNFPKANRQPKTGRPRRHSRRSSAPATLTRRLSPPRTVSVRAGARGVRALAGRRG